MPYIKQADRDQYDNAINELVELLEALDRDTSKGHHNYIMYTLALRLAKALGIRYHTLQDIIGTFDCCKLEFYRKVVAPYEDKAIERNGDVT